MTKLLITDITRMGPAFCVIGLAHEDKTIHSIRPIPPQGVGWAQFPYRRGDILEFNLHNLPCERPHVEDRVSTRGMRKVREIPHGEVVKYLRRAECADCLKDLFGCEVHENRTGRGVFIPQGQGNRSICGCSTQNLRIERVGKELRAALALSTGESLRDIPVVDRDWNEFVESALAPARGKNLEQRLQRFLASHLDQKILDSSEHFIRLGVTRPHLDCCWLMLDTLFPLPQTSWLEEF
jgi:hypothetical protein